MKKCYYCCKKVTGDYKYCSDECEHAAEKFLGYAKRFMPLFYVVIALCTIMMIVGAVVSLLLINLSLFILGILLIIFPFVTPQTVDGIGLKKSIVFGRIGGIILILGGVLFHFLII